jgi:hypothetical protein
MFYDPCVWSATAATLSRVPLPPYEGDAMDVDQENNPVSLMQRVLRAFM